MSHPLRFGLMLPQGSASWAQTVEVAQAADEHGFHSIHCVDHFVGIPMDTTPCLEGWTEIAALAGVTRRVRLGHLVLCVSYRSPALLAKMAATLDVISSGRMIVGLGAGWHSGEYEQYGYEFPPIGVRLGQLGETLAILRSMWTAERTTITGRHFSIRDAACFPKPVQARLPILIGGGGEKVLLKHVARHADIWNNLGVSHRDVAEKRKVLDAHCRMVGRDPAEIVTSQQCLAAISTDRAEAARRSESIVRALGFLDAAPELALLGTPDEIRGRVDANRALGVTSFIMTLGRKTEPEDVRLFGREVIAAFA